MSNELEILFGYVCPICKEVYKDKQKARSCLKSHEYYSIQESYSMGSPWPINLRVWKILAGKKIEWKDYNPEPEVHKVR